MLRFIIHIRCGEAACLTQQYIITQNVLQYIIATKCVRADKEAIRQIRKSGSITLNYKEPKLEGKDRDPLAFAYELQ